ncbi:MULTISPECIES: hypothetical protein [Nocardioides]|jgi:hypothetical protein|uniref:hypothetical protein n=1 Tax=Nocardioides TaxID=1839 RepID=UPI00032F910A|nr:MULTISPECIES: hypothetical protein [Nocardioides]EON23463.1 hypothetical protein CF8_2587 [Nocardioides sp. CF8]
MRARIGALPPVSRTTAVLMLAVPLVLWLFLVWDTRPYSPEEIAADRAAAESAPGFARTLAECEASVYPRDVWTGSGFTTISPSTSHCRRDALEAHSSLTREPLGTDDHPGTVVVILLSMPAAMLLVGVRWQPAPGARAFLRRAGKVLLLGTVVAFVVNSTWWWALGWVAERRGVLHLSTPMQFISGHALLVGLTGVVGLTAGVLLRGPVRAVSTLATAAVAIGVVVLLAHPIEPWLPLLNIEAFLSGGAEYDQPPREVSCASLYGSSIPGSGSLTCTDRRANHSFRFAGLYFFGLTGILVAAAALANTRRRGTPQPA